MFSRRRLGDKAVVDRLALPYGFKNIELHYPAITETRSTIPTHFSNEFPTNIHRLIQIQTHQSSFHVQI